MSYLKDQRRKQHNRGVERVDRLLEKRRAGRPIPRYLIDGINPEIREAIKAINRRKKRLKRGASRAGARRPVRTAIDVSTNWRAKD